MLRSPHTTVNATWLPSMAETGDTLQARVVEAIRSDIASGLLRPGQRLPTQRELARSLGIGIGTITRAYSEAERQGLITSHVGRGTFVATPPVPAPPTEQESGPIDLAMNVPYLLPAACRLPAALQAASRRADLSDVLSLSGHAGIEWQRRTYAQWLVDHHEFGTVDWQRLIVCTGAQHAMNLAVRTLCRAGDTILTEDATFFGMRALAEAECIHLAGVDMDEHGIIPEALERTARATGARVLYIQPTLHNPTARSMPAVRRLHIADLARSLNLTVIESDVYGALAHEAARSFAATPPARPLATVIPERTYYIAGASKVMAPGLRIGFLVAPDDAAIDRISFLMHAECFAPPTLPSLIAPQWMNDGTADLILAEIAAEAASRVSLARTILGPAMAEPSYDTSLHVWLPMGELQAERVRNTALRHGIALTPPDAVSTGSGQTTGLRVCLNGPESRALLESALRSVAAALQERPNRAIV